MNQIMAAEEITIRVDPEAASAYRRATDPVRRKIDLLISLAINDATRSGASLQQIINDISARARQRGLTAEQLNAILDDA